MDNAYDLSTLEAAIADANIQTLACVLVQQTGDLRWIEPPYVPTRKRGLEDNDTGGLPEAVQKEVRAAPLHASAASFADTPPLLPDPPALPVPAGTHALVIGAGISGWCTAIAFARRNSRRHARTGRGRAGKRLACAGGLIRRLLWRDR